MASLKNVVSELLTKLRTIQVGSLEGFNTSLYATIWNNQLSYIKDGKQHNIPFPAAFVEFISPVAYEQLGVGVVNAELGINIHIIAEQFDSGDGFYDQNLTIFDIRDAVLHSVRGSQLTGCSSLMFVGENQDYDHDNLYHYIISFVTNYIDSNFSEYDPSSTEKTTYGPPTSLELVASKSNEVPTTIKQPYNIPS